MGQPECREKLRGLCADCGLSLSDEQAALCCRHLDLVALWNRRVNLTRVTGNEALVKHVMDSLLPAQWLPEVGLALDVGSGAGFPGVPLAVIRPGLHVTLLESDRKKASFLKVAAADLALKNITVLHGRFEGAPWSTPPARSLEAPQKAWIAPRFDVITVRAVKMQAGMLQKMGSVLSSDGVIAYWAGPSPQGPLPEHVAVGRDAIVVRLEDAPYELPGMRGRRRLIRWMRRES